MSSKKTFDLSSQFLSLLDPTAQLFTFQTFDDNEQRRNRELIHVLHGSLPRVFEKLSGLNQRGAGIFVTVNETDGNVRKAENIKRVRAIWQDDDEGFDGAFPLPPSLIVSTSPGKFQRLWLCDGLSKEEFRGSMKTMVDAYGSDKRAADIVRVLRLPGFYHTKRQPHLVSIVEASGKRYGRDELLEAFPAPKASSPPKKPPTPRPFSTLTSSSDHVSSEVAYRIKNALKVLDRDQYDKWLQVGMILHGVYHGDEEGLGVWMNWASASEKFDEEEHRYKWGTFGRSEGAKLGLGSLFRIADEALYGT